MVGRLAIRGGNLRIIMGYAPQETEPFETREEFFNELSIEIQRGTQSGDQVLVVGDLNAKIEEDGGGNIIKTSKNGKLLCTVVQDSDLHVMNLSQKCYGKWTHVIRTTGEASRLDYVLADGRTESQITKILIDESTLMCPFRSKKKERILTDHN